MGQHDPGLGVPEMYHVFCLRDVEADQEPVPVRPQGRLQLPEPLDTDGICSHTRHGVFPPLCGGEWTAFLSPLQIPGKAPFRTRMHPMTLKEPRDENTP